MRIIRYLNDYSNPVVAAVTDDNKIYPLPMNDFMDIIYEAKHAGLTPVNYINELITGKESLQKDLSELNLLVPIVAPEVWASGVTYEKSREARNYETTDKKTMVKHVTTRYITQKGQRYF
ncbi:hypothetical protein ACVIJU_002179 [Aeribacillus sp. SP014]